MTYPFRVLLYFLRRLALRIGRFNTVLLLSIAFYLLLLPLAWLRRRFRSPELTGWIRRVPRDRNHFEKQY